MIIDRYHCNLNVSRLNAEHSRAYYIPFGSPEELDGNRDDSSRFKLLSGCKWAFSYFDSYDDVPRSITDKSADISDWSRIFVPSCWELQGYGSAEHVGGYDFPRDLPNIPKANPTGVYAVDFTIHDDIDIYSKYLVFEGVSSCVYLYLNGEFVGYSQGSHSMVEFDITGYLTTGKNRLTAVVTKWCDGSYLESHDDWKMSGIFRDVYLLVRPKGHVEDVFIKTEVANDYKTATVKVEIESPIAAESIITLFNSSGEKIDADAFADNGTATLTVEDPRLWSAEYPELYKIVIESANEFVPISFGIRTVKSEDGIFRFNGRPIKLHGVNHHGFNSRTGAVYSYEDMKKDLVTMKRNNINAIRTADFPAEPRFYELCDKLGFYVIAEAEVNCSGMGDDLGRRKIVDNPFWESQLNERVMTTVETLKNSPSIVMWSLGNNSGYGRAIKNAALNAKLRDSTRVVVYQSNGEIESIDETVRFHPSSLDVLSEKSLTPADCSEICETLKKLGSQKPFILSEYCNNGAGGLKEYWDVINNYDNFCGAFIYEWNSRALSLGKQDNGKVKYIYQKDAADRILSGMVSPEGKSMPLLKDHKNSVKPFSITPISLQDGTFLIKNCYDFSYMSRLEGNWELTRNGAVVASGNLGSMAIPPQREEEIALGYQIPDDGRCYLKISFASYGNDLIPDGEVVGFEQFALPTDIYLEEKLTFGNVDIKENLKKVVISSDSFRYVYDKVECAFSSIMLGGKELLKNGMKFNAWRATVDCDRAMLPVWQAVGLDRLSTYEYDTEVIPEEGYVTIASTGMMSAAGCDPVLTFRCEWTVFANGLIELHSDISVNIENVKYLPRFGLAMEMDRSFDTVEFFGYGPFQSYCDRHAASYIGKFTNKVNREFTDYVCPKDSGNHYGTYWSYVRNSNGLGLIFSNEADAFDFSAVPYSPSELSAITHSYQLPVSDKTVVSVDYKQSGVGNTDTHLRENKFIFNLSILPTETIKNYPL